MNVIRAAADTLGLGEAERQAENAAEMVSSCGGCAQNLPCAGCVSSDSCGRLADCMDMCELAVGEKRVTAHSGAGS